jgi:hypothetical protein
MFKGKVLLFSLLLVFASTAYAGDVDPCRCDWGWGNVNCTISPYVEGVFQGSPRIAICPQGDFEFIREGCSVAGPPAQIYTDDYIWVDVKDNSGNGIAGVPWSDYWLQACDPGEELCLCANSIVADSLTNSVGRTTFSGRIAGGGCVVNDGLYLAVQGKIILSDYPTCVTVKCVNLIIVTVDLTADCNVNLSDLGVFGLSYNKDSGEAGFNTCCDYNDDNKCNLSDFAFMGEHYLHTCF